MKKTRKTMRLCLGLGLFAWSMGGVVLAQEASKTTPKVGVAEPHKQEAAIRASVGQFVKAYNAHDAKAVSELFLPEAQIVNEADNTIQGRADIEALFAGVFEESQLGCQDWEPEARACRIKELDCRTVWRTDPRRSRIGRVI